MSLLARIRWWFLMPVHRGRDERDRAACMRTARAIERAERLARRWNER